MRRIAIVLAVCVLAVCASAPACAQQPAAAPAKGLSVVHLMGMGDLAKNAKGTLTIEGDKLVFSATGSKTHSELAAGAIDDVQTADDSRRLVGGTLSHRCKNLY